LNLLGIVHRRVPIFGKVQTTASVSIATVALGAVTGVVVARGLGPTARGELVIASVGPQLIGTLMILGIDEAVVFLLARAKSTAEAGRIIGSSIAVAASLGVVGTGVAELLQWLYFAPASHNVAAIVIYGYGTLPLVYMCTQVALGMMRARQQYDLWNVCRGVIPVIYLLSVSLLTFTHRLSTSSVLAALYAANLLLFLYLTVRISSEQQRQISPQHAFDLLRLGIQNHLISIGQLVNQRLDQFVLARLVSATQLGYYAVAVTYASLPLVLAMAPAWHLYSQGSQVGSIPERQFRSLQLNTTAAMAIVVVVGGLCAPLVMTVVFSQAFSPSVVPAVVLLVGAPPLALSALRAAAWKASGQPLPAAFAEGVGTVVTIAGLLLFAQRFGIIAAAATSVAAYTAVTAVLFLVRTPPIIGHKGEEQPVGR
jgi:O-antigen/teichoic acid export membrane protein